MSTNIQSRSGYTLLEMMTSILLLTLAIAGAMSGYLFVFRGERINSAQNALDIEVRNSMERIRTDLRLSSMDKIVLFPDGAGPYAAISFPMAVDNNGDGLVELGTNGLIIWDQTVIYHPWSSSNMWPMLPEQLRRTVIDPRDNSLTAQQMKDQLSSIVTNGDCSKTYDAGNAHTVPLFRNVFNWKIWGKGSTFDAYSPTPGVEPNVPFGSILLSSGTHNFKFSVSGKNVLSGGYRMGLDSIVGSPCGMPREAEEQTIAAQSGASAFAALWMSGNWRNNQDLTFPATATGQYVTLQMANDQWEETTFDGLGAVCDDTFVTFDTSWTNFVLRVPSGTNDGWQGWAADQQTLNDEPEDGEPDNFRGCAVRILCRGDAMMGGSGFVFSGPLHCIYIYAGAGPLKITRASIAEAASNTVWTPNYNPTTWIPLNILTEASAYQPLRCTPPSTTNFYISREKSYIVSFLVSSDAGKGSLLSWPDLHPTNAISSYVISASNYPTSADLDDPTWDDRPYVVATNIVFGLEHLHTLPPTNGTFTSQIVDTGLEAPVYSLLNFRADEPAGTEIRIRVRSGNNPDMSGASAWSNALMVTASGASLASLPASRYVQFRAELTPTNSGAIAYVPSLKDVTIKWTGESRVTDVGAAVTKGPNQGILELTVDDKPLVKGITIDLTIFQDVPRFHGGSYRVTSTLSAEVEPRNTGK